MGTQPILEVNGNRNSIINSRCEWTLSLNNLFISVICDKILYMFLKESTELQNIQTSMCDAGCFILIRREFVRYVTFCFHQWRIKVSEGRASPVQFLLFSYSFWHKLCQIIG